VKHLTSLFILPVIWLLWDDDRQNLYDKLVKTYVVKKKVGGVKSFFRGCFVFVFTIIFIICLVIFGSGYFFYAGVPALSNFIVSGVPKSLDKEVGKEARKELVRRASIDEKKSELLQEFYDELNYNTRTKVFVVRESEFNAFALPDNSIFVFDKVFEDLDDYTELAALLGHEYTHISKRHSMKILANALTRELIAEILTGGDNSDNFVRNANKLLVLSNSRAFETEADLGGLSLLREHNIDPSGMSKLFRIMLKLPQESEKETPSFLSTHPDTEDRLDEVDEAIKAKPSDAKPHDKLELIFKELKTLEDDHSF
jgi:beta-barrel assembly-enhancing protease